MLLRQEYALIVTADGVLPESVSVYEHKPENGQERCVITFSVERGDPADTKEPRIQPVEPIALVYAKNQVGKAAPWIYSERVDFPRDLPHSNPVNASCPASPCIAREGTQAIYDRSGVKLVIGELVSWLTDAAAGTLERDGWEPVPVLSSFELCADLTWLQQQAYTHGRRSVNRFQGLGHLIFVERDKRLANLYAEISSEIKSVADIGKHSPHFEEIPSQDEIIARIDIPWYFAAGRSDQPSTDRLSILMDSPEALLEISKSARCNAAVAQILNELIPNLKGNRYRYACVIVGIWRPEPLIPDIPGLADSFARHCELKACCLRLAEKQGEISVDQVYPLGLLSAPTRQLMANMSGLEAEPLPGALIGCGALGSKLVEFLTREGLAKITIMDPETLAPHNLARHSLSKNSIGLSKAKELKRRLESIVGSHDQFSCRARQTRVDSLDKKSFEDEIGKSPRWIIDATADLRAVNYLDRLHQNRPVMRAEIANQGRLGLLSVEGSERNPRLGDLVPMLYISALNWPEISAWLQQESTSSAMSIGMGCTSASMLASDSLIALHASAFMPAINVRITGAAEKNGGFGINLVDEHWQPTGWTWLEVPPFEIFPIEPTEPVPEPWEMRIHPEVLKRIKNEADSAQPRETGGFLYGTYSVQSRSFTVVEAIEVAPQKASATSLVLPPAGNSAAEKRILACCGTTIKCLGTWHSHGSGDATWSVRDQAQAAKFAKMNQMTPQPTVMMIVAPKKHRGYLILPEGM
ncbi:MAG: hypothetical protein GY815_07135 [Gammaproteobacteria bacterium]|nr:hypothetical protein [Gammaproteobacteria bacterium]